MALSSKVHNNLDFTHQSTLINLLFSYDAIIQIYYITKIHRQSHDYYATNFILFLKTSYMYVQVKH